MRRGETVEIYASTCALAVRASQSQRMVLFSIDGDAYALSLQHALDLSALLQNAVISVLDDNVGPHEGGQQ